MADFLNCVQLSGRIIDEPKVRKPDNRKLTVLTFMAETLEAVGKNRRVEPVRWRAKIFGALAEQATKDLGRSVHVVVVGRISGYEGAADTSGKKNTKRNDVDVVIDVHRYAVLPQPEVVYSCALEETESSL